MALYHFLCDLSLTGFFYPAGSCAYTAHAGGTLPEGWVPTPAVEPLDAAALAAFYAIRPAIPPVARQFDPQTYWVVTHGEVHDRWTLTGLGADLPAINM
jgi:hypothetical protein